MKRLNQYQILQLSLFALVVLFWVLLGVGLAKIPTGLEGQWFDKIWDLILLVMSIRTLASLVENQGELKPPKVETPPPETAKQPLLQNESGCSFVQFIALILGLSMLALFGCATTSGKTDSPQIVAGKSLLAIQQSIVTTRDAIGVPCQKGAIPQADCQKMNDWYLQSKPAYDAAETAAVIDLKGGVNDESAKQNLIRLETEILGLAAQYGIKGGAQ